MNSRTKVLLVILGAIFLIGVGVFIWGKSTGKLASSAAGFGWPPIGGGDGISGYFGDLVVLVKDKQTGKPITGATVAFNGKISNGALRTAGVKCTNHSLTTGSDGKALFTKANNSKDLKTWAKGEISGITQEGICEYTVTTTKTGYKTDTQFMSWPDKPANRTNLGQKVISLVKVGYGTLSGNITWNGMVYTGGICGLQFTTIPPSPAIEPSTVNCTNIYSMKIMGSDTGITYTATITGNHMTPPAHGYLTKTFIIKENQTTPLNLNFVTTGQ